METSYRMYKFLVLGVLSTIEHQTLFPLRVINIKFHITLHLLE